MAYMLPPKWHSEDDRILTSKWGAMDPIWIAERVAEARIRRAKERLAQGNGSGHYGPCRAGTVILRAAFLGLVPIKTVDALARRWYRAHDKKDKLEGRNDGQKTVYRL